MIKKPRRVALSLILCLACAGASGAAELGAVYYQLPELGVVDPRAEPLESGQLVKTVNEPAIVHLDNGQVLRLDANTAVKLDAADADDVKVTVLSGRVLKWAPGEGALAAGAGSWFLLGPLQADPLAVEGLLMDEPAPADPQRQDRPAGR